MDQRTKFALKALKTENFRALCAEYGISAKTGYKWWKRLLQYGTTGLAEESRRPRRHPGQLAEGVVCEMVRLKLAHRHWGAAQDPGAVSAAPWDGGLGEQLQAGLGTGGFDRAAPAAGAGRGGGPAVE